MTLQIRDIAPHLEVETTECPVRFHSWIDYRGLRSDQRQRVAQHVIRHPQAARAQASHDLGGAGMRTLQAAAATIRALAKAVLAAAGKWWRAHTIRRARIAAIRELHALDDRTLRDIGVSRSEIEWVVVYGRDAPPWASPARGRGSAKEGFLGQPSGPVESRTSKSKDTQQRNLRNHRAPSLHRRPVPLAVE
jgi:uncharacterized protein YjiS (DUF1127 family)